VLNAKQHEKEAFVVAQAGKKGSITVSTNMAGRGTDIILGGSAEMLAKLDFKEQGRDELAEPAEYLTLVEKYERDCKAEGDEVRAAGGLHIVGTERHESRRIDNQLRGRAGRQGDPGSSRFYLSLEDDLMRIFAGDRVKSLMERMGMPDDEPIEHPWVSKSIGDAQGKVEARNFDIRKNVLEYDDVMNEQRKTVYKIRQHLLLGIYKPEVMDEEGRPTGNLRVIKPLERLEGETKEGVEAALLANAKMIAPSSAEDVGSDGYRETGKRPAKVADIQELDITSLRNDIYQEWGYRFDVKEDDAKNAGAIYKRLLAEIPQSLTEQRERLLDLIDSMCGAIIEECAPQNKPPEDWDWKGIKDGFVEHFGTKPPEDFENHHDIEDLVHILYKKAEETLLAKEADMGTGLLLRVFRHFYLEEMDRQWVEHLTSMEHLRDGIGLRGYGQKDPKQEYKKEGYSIFITMMASTSSNVVTKVFQVQVKRETDIERMEREDAARHERELGSLQLRHGSEFPEEEAPPPRRAPQIQPRRSEAPKVSRNDLCPCGSGLKFKKCHGEALDDGTSEDEASPGGGA